MQGDSCRPSTGKLSKGCAATRKRREESSQLKPGSHASCPHVPSHIQPKICIRSVCNASELFVVVSPIARNSSLVQLELSLYIVSMLHMYLIDSLLCHSRYYYSCELLCLLRSLVLASHQFLLLREISSHFAAGCKAVQKLLSHRNAS